MTDLLDRPRIDPRFAQRWVEARRQEGRRRLRILLAVTGVIAASAIALGILYSPVFGVRHADVAVEGSGPLDAAAVRTAAGLAGHRLMMDVDAGRIAARLDADPWLGDARVARQWPATVKVQVTEREPIAQVEVETSRAGTASGWAEVDHTGRVLVVATAKVKGLAVLTGAPEAPEPGGWLAGTPGPTASAEASAAAVDTDAPSATSQVPSGAAAALAFLQVLPASERADVASIGAAGRSGFSLQMSAGGGSSPMTVRLGDGSMLAQKAAALVTLLQAGDLAHVSVVDLSVPSRPTVATRAS